MRTAHLLRTLVLTLVGAVFATAAGAVDMTGTWEGQERCNCFNAVDGRFTERYRDEVMEITQDGTDLNIEAYGELFNGNVISHPHRDSKGEASLIACDTDPTDNASFGEIGRAKVSAKANGRGRMTIRSLWNAQEGQICTCTSKMHRTDASDPEIDDCSGGNAVDKWHKAMLEVEESVGGCYKAEYPSPDWVEVTCAAPSSKRSRSFSRTVGGGGNFWSVNTPAGHHLTKVTGSFENISGVKTITDNSIKYGNRVNYYTLQLNSNLFTDDYGSSGCAQSSNPHCKGWVQYVYYNQGNDPGEMTIWYILVDYNIDDKTCPSRNASPHWRQFDGSCYLEAVTIPVPPTTVAQLGDMQLTGSVDLFKNVEHAVIRVGGILNRASVKDRYVWFNGMWTQAEFNVYGAGGGSRANFNANSSLDVKLVIDEYSGGTLTCDKHLHTTTGETNNLNQVMAGPGACKLVPNSSPPAFTFNENNR